MARPRIVFAVISAVTPPETMEQLADALRPHTVLVHHDFSQTPDFRLRADNVRFVPNPRRTGWASFGFVEAIFHTLAYAAEQMEFDYLQLLSPTCLPVQPMAAFEAHVQGPFDAHFGAIDLLADHECLMNVGYRAFTPQDTLRHRALRWMCTQAFAEASGRREEAGVWLRTGADRGLRGWATSLALRAIAAPSVGRHPFDPGFRPYYGSTWFGAKPHVVAALAQAFRQPELRGYFGRLRISEEFLVPSLLMRLAPQHGPLNHYISRFDEAHPSRIAVGDIDMLRDCGAFFARKFPEDPTAAVRVRVLEELVRSPATQPQAEPAMPAPVAVPDLVDKPATPVMPPVAVDPLLPAPVLGTPRAIG